MTIIVPAINLLQLYTKGSLNQDPTSNLGKLWSCIATQIDELEAQISLLKNILYINTTTGLNLDKVGNLLNLERAAGRTDQQFRLDLIVAAIQESATATIPDLVTLGKIVAGNNDEAMFRPFEMYLLPPTPKVLDSTWILDSLLPLSPIAKKPASVNCSIEGDIDTIQIPIQVAIAMGNVRGAGIATYFTIVFKTLVSKMTRYLGDINSPISLALGDGAIALGDGGVQPPQPGDTGLTHEVYRKSVNQKVLPNGDWDFYINIPTADLNSYTINEEALFDKNGNMIVKYTFGGKAKNSSLANEYHIIDDL